MQNYKPVTKVLGFIFKMAGIIVTLQRLFVQLLTIKSFKECCCLDFSFCFVVPAMHDHFLQALVVFRFLEVFLSYCIVTNR